MSPQENPTPAKKTSLSKASYLISILVAFLVPIGILLKRLWSVAPKKPLFVSTGIIAVLGWIWSYIVSSHGWWVFGEDYILGVNVFPHLPLEEFLFYPLGGVLCILFYLMGSRWKRITNPGVYWSFLIVGTVIFGVISIVTRANGPYYLYSQMVLYNFFCCLVLAPWVAKELNLVGLAVPIAILTVVGFLWDYIAFSKGWWNYYAVTKIYLSVVPLDDFNFFFYAPTAAVSVYHLVCRILKTAPLRE